MVYGKVVSIDIGSRNIHIVEGCQQRNGIEVENAVMIQTPASSFADGRIVNLAPLRDAIRSALSQNRIKTRKAVLTIQSTAVITREFILPSVKQDELDTMVQLEIERYLPIVANEYIVQYKVLGESIDENMKKIHVQVAAMPRDMAEGCFHFLWKIKLKPFALDINSNAVSKLLTGDLTINGQRYSTGCMVVILDIGHCQTGVNIISDGKAEFSRTLMFGGRDIDSEVSKCLKITMEEAEQWKLNKLKLDEPAYMGSFPEDIYNSVSQVLDQWVSEVQKIISYCTNRNPLSKIKAVYLYGGSSAMNGLSEYMERHLGIPAEVISSISSISTVKNMTGQNVRNYINAVGGMIRC